MSEEIIQKLVIDVNAQTAPEFINLTGTELTAYNASVASRPTELQIKLKALREERNQKLAETDWWASSDLTITSEQRAYRQALRDITEGVTIDTNIVWPTKP